MIRAFNRSCSSEVLEVRYVALSWFVPALTRQPALHTADHVTCNEVCPVAREVRIQAVYIFAVPRGGFVFASTSRDTSTISQVSRDAPTLAQPSPKHGTSVGVPGNETAGLIYLALA